jgi:hypothetical protein
MWQKEKVKDEEIRGGKETKRRWKKKDKDK